MCRTLHKHINCTTKKIFLELYPCRTIGSIIEFQPDLSENIITTAKLSSDLIYDSPSPHLKLFCKSLISRKNRPCVALKMALAPRFTPVFASIYSNHKA